MRWLPVACGLGLALLAAPAFAAGTAPLDDPTIDPAPCFAAAAASDDERIVEACGRLLDSRKTARDDRLKALVARAGAFARTQRIDRAIADDDAALLLDPRQPDVLNARGELWRGKGDRRKALADFAAALRLQPDHAAARANHKSLAMELERLGARMAVDGKPSFDCARARRAVEKAICADRELAKLDRDIAELHAHVLREGAGRPSEQKLLARQQQKYLAARNDGFGRPGYDLRAAMKARLLELTGVDGY
jgi:tetratricopeptide (TPR) repeat protein